MKYYGNWRKQTISTCILIEGAAIPLLTSLLDRGDTLYGYHIRPAKTEAKVTITFMQKDLHNFFYLALAFQQKLQQQLRQEQTDQWFSQVEKELFRKHNPLNATHTAHTPQP